MSVGKLDLVLILPGSKKNVFPHHCQTMEAGLSETIPMLFMLPVDE
jgi:hypothetical protein